MSKYQREMADYRIRFTKYPDGKRESCFLVRVNKDGGEVRDGFYIYWYSSGEIGEITNYQDGKKHGSHVMWYKSGAPAATTIYDDGELVERWIEFDDEGNCTKYSKLTRRAANGPSGTGRNG